MCFIFTISNRLFDDIKLALIEIFTGPPHTCNSVTDISWCFGEEIIFNITNNREDGFLFS